LFTVPNPTADEEVDFLEYYNRDSLTTIQTALMESSLLMAEPGKQFQFLRHGYFCVDPDSREDRKVFNKTVGLKDSFSKEVKK
jgi:glutaminyl-tRNA synthetase